LNHKSEIEKLKEEVEFAKKSEQSLRQELREATQKTMEHGNSEQQLRSKLYAIENRMSENESNHIAELRGLNCKIVSTLETVSSLRNELVALSEEAERKINTTVLSPCFIGSKSPPALK